MPSSGEPASPDPHTTPVAAPAEGHVMSLVAPGHPATASVLLTDPSGRLLVVQAPGPGTWHLPGGLVEQGESPRDAARREVREELGLDLDLRDARLLAVEWLQATRADRRDRLAFLFTGPRLDRADTIRITPHPEEIAAWRWMTPADARPLLHPSVASRLGGALTATGGAVYRELRHERTT